MMWRNQLKIGIHMIAAPMKVPKNLQSRLSPDVWLAGEAIARYRKMSTREGFEYAVRAMVDKLAESDPKFSAIWEEVKTEGITPEP